VIEEVGATPSRVGKNLVTTFLTQGFKANPGLKLANAFSVQPQSDFILNQYPGFSNRTIGMATDYN
jgi:hypothetical protein